MCYFPLFILFSGICDGGGARNFRFSLGRFLANHQQPISHDCDLPICRTRFKQKEKKTRNIRNISCLLRGMCSNTWQIPMSMITLYPRVTLFFLFCSRIFSLAPLTLLSLRAIARSFHTNPSQQYIFDIPSLLYLRSFPPPHHSHHLRRVYHSPAISHSTRLHE